MLKLYTGILSLFGRKTEIGLAEKGLAFERIQVPFSQAKGYSPKDPAVMAANPKGQVPVLIASDGAAEGRGALVLYDSTVILEYLEDAYPQPPLYPKAPADRARCRQLELLGDEVMLAPLRKLMYRNEAPLADSERLAALRAGAREAEGVIAAQYAELERRLDGRDFLCGAFSAADIAVFMPVHYAQRLAGPAVTDHAALAAWYDRLAARPAFAAAIAEIAEADRTLSFPLDRG